MSSSDAEEIALRDLNSFFQPLQRGSVHCCGEIRTTESPVYRSVSLSRSPSFPPQHKLPHTSHKQHLALLLHRPHLAVAALVLLVNRVDRLFNLAEHQVAMAVVCL